MLRHPMPSARPLPRSCDTFVFVGGDGGPAATIFGKNADRPADEEHEVLYVPSMTHPSGTSLQCTHIQIPQVENTLAVVLSKPAWMWGTEMGANENGVVGGNEAVNSFLADELGDEPRLLGMDLLRLGLERGRTAREAVDVICALLEAHGQGGACEEGGDWTYENGFLLADATEAFVIETAGVRHWAVERVPPGKSRNISNGLSIRTIDECSKGLKELCIERGWWDGTTAFDFKLSLELGGGLRANGAARAHEALERHGREKAGFIHLQRAEAQLKAGTLQRGDERAWLAWMKAVLRDEGSGICFRSTHGFMSTGSMISWIGGDGVSEPRPGHSASHRFTAASDPHVAVYKRFAFSQAHGTAAPTNFGSLDLWRKWRHIDLKGGLTRAAVSAAAADGTRKGMREIEGAEHTLPLDAAIVHELGLLTAATSSAG